MFALKIENAKFTEYAKNTMGKCINAITIYRIYFFSIRVFFHGHWRLAGKQGTIFYSTLPLPPAHEHSGIYLQLCMWDDYQIFLIAPLVLPDCHSMRFTALSNYHLIDWWCDIDFCLFTRWFDSRFLLQQFDMGNRWI